MEHESTDQFAEEVSQTKWTEKLSKNEPLAGWTTIRVGGPAKYFQIVHTQPELIRLLKLAHKHHVSWSLIGNGTNLLVPNEGFDGLVIQLQGDFKCIGQTSNRLVGWIQVIGVSEQI